MTIIEWIGHASPEILPPIAAGVSVLGGVVAAAIYWWVSRPSEKP